MLISLFGGGGGARGGAGGRIADFKARGGGGGCCGTVGGNLVRGGSGGGGIAVREGGGGGGGGFVFALGGGGGGGVVSTLGDSVGGESQLCCNAVTPKPWSAAAELDIPSFSSFTFFSSESAARCNEYRSVCRADDCKDGGRSVAFVLSDRSCIGSRLLYMGLSKVSSVPYRSLQFSSLLTSEFEEFLAITRCCLRSRLSFFLFSFDSNSFPSSSFFSLIHSSKKNSG